MLRLALISCFLPVFFSTMVGQRDSTAVPLSQHEDFGGVILMDSIVVSATRSGFNVQDFIRLVRNDKSFYTAFRNIRVLSYSADNEIKMFNKKGRNKAAYDNKIRQLSDGECRTMIVMEEKVHGNFYKKRNQLRYYTAKLFDQLFFTHGTVCESENTAGNSTENIGADKHITELKKLIFSPGEKADVPLIGKKTEIFSDEMRDYYDFAISSEQYKGGIECYVFSANVKTQYQNRKEGKTVIKSLYTYFDKSNFQVVARTYQLQYSGLLFDFDVNMKIELKKLGDRYVPEYLEYDGFWNVPLKKPEISKFHARFYHYE